MNYTTLTLSGLTRNRTRVALTLLSIAAAFLLFGLLRPVASLFEEGPKTATTGRLIVSAKHSISDMLTLAHVARIKNLAEVEIVAHQTWFGGTYIDPSNNFPQWAVSAETFLNLSAEIELPLAQHNAFLTKRTGAIAGRELAKKYGWKLGDKIPLIPTIWHNTDGKHWEFELVGIFDGASAAIDTRRLYLNFDYFDEYRAFAKGSISNVLLTADEATTLSDVAIEVDALFANSHDETTTVTESEYILSFARQLGDIALIVNSILSAVFFTILLLTANTMSQSTRERIPDYAVLKTLGFKNAHVFAMILVESILITCSGATLGLIIAIVLIENLDTLLPSLGQLSNISVNVSDCISAMLLAVALGFLVAMPPAAKATRTSIIDALRST